MTGVAAWFSARSPRERRLLLVALALAVVTLVWGGVVIPVRDALSSARERHATAVERLGLAAARVDLLRRVGRRPALGGDLVALVRAEADAAGFALATVDLQGAGSVRATIQSARPGALAGWLARLEARGVLVDAATLTDHGDRTVGAVLVLKARAA